MATRAKERDCVTKSNSRLWQGLLTLPLPRPEVSKSKSHTAFGREMETFGRYRGLVGRPGHNLQHETLRQDDDEGQGV